MSETTTANNQVKRPAAPHPLQRRTSHSEWAWIYMWLSVVCLSIPLIAFLVSDAMDEYAIFNGVSFIPLAFGSVICLLAFLHMLAANVLESKNWRRTVSTIVLTPLFLTMAFVVMPMAIMHIVNNPA